ncbi:MAG: DoxX family protein [Planctomycetota bacterium]
MFATPTLSPTVRAAGLDAGLLVIRLALGIVFFYHGGQKLLGLFGGGGLAGTAAFFENVGIPFPQANAVMAASAEFFGAIALLAGVATRFAGLTLAGVMAVAIITVKWGTFANTAGGMEYPLTLGLIAIALLLTGPGRLTLPSLITAIRGHRTQPAAAPATA